MIIRPFQEDDWPSLWPVLRDTFRTGDTYPQPPDISEQDARTTWIDTPAATFVAAEPHGPLLGTYYLQPNKPGLGSHVCNAGYIVAGPARGRGVGSGLCLHSLRQAREMGFRAMQYNLVVTTNLASIRLWKKHGFRIVGTLPGAFRHMEHGFVDALVMYRSLDEIKPGDEQ